MKILKVILTTACIFLLSSCNSNTPLNTNGTSSSDAFEWNESSVFRAALSEDTTSNWGFQQSEEMNLEIIVADFEDPYRITIEDEVDSTIPAECIDIASLVSTSKKSGAQFYLSQSYSEFNNRTLQITIYAFSSEKAAKKQFAKFLNKAPQCGYYIPVWANGQKAIPMDLWKNLGPQDPNNFKVSNKLYNEASALGVVGSAIYNIYVSVENNSELAIKISEEIEPELQKHLSAIQK
jgi:hypothetical protein